MILKILRVRNNLSFGKINQHSVARRSISEESTIIKRFLKALIYAHSQLSSFCGFIYGILNGSARAPKDFILPRSLIKAS